MCAAGVTTSSRRTNSLTRVCAAVKVDTVVCAALAKLAVVATQCSGADAGKLGADVGVDVRTLSGVPSVY